MSEYKPELKPHVKKHLDSLVESANTFEKLHKQWEEHKEMSASQIVEQAKEVTSACGFCLTALDWTYDGSCDVEAVNTVSAMIAGNAISSSIHFAELLGNCAGDRKRAEVELKRVVDYMSETVDAMLFRVFG